MKIFTKRILRSIFGGALLAAVLLSGACVDDDTDESYLGSMAVTLTAPENLPEMTFTGLSITVLNTADGVQKTQAADEDGKALFEGLTAGTYNVSVAGKSGEATINGVKNGVVVESQKQVTVDVQLVASIPDPTPEPDPYAGLVIKEVFYSGHSYTYDEFGATLMKDHFIELFNNSDQTIYLDGLYVADVWTPATADFETAPLLSILEDPSLDHDYIYANIVVRIPGSGSEHPLEPGKSFLIATNAIDFKSEVEKAGNEYGMPVDAEKLSHIIDLSVADMETYAVKWMQEQGRTGNDYFDLDNPAVSNVENIYYTKNSDFFYLDPTGAAPVVFRSEEELNEENIYVYSYQPQGSTTPSEIALMKIPAECVIDGADFVNNRESARWKRLPAVIDMGFGYIPNDTGSLMNVGQRRKIDEEASAKAGRCILQDTNNTTNDFEPVDPPTPKGGYEGYDIR